MVNRAETLSNLGGLSDVTAWRAIKNAEKRVKPMPPNAISELNGELSTLWKLKKTGEINPMKYRVKQQELASKLHEAERQRGNKPVRTTNKPHR